MLVMLFLMLFPSGAFAHSSLERSTPGDQEVVTRSLTEIVLEFNSRIEKISTITLLDGQGQEIPVQSSVDGTTLTGTLQEPLPSGQYRVVYKIVAADGHRIEKEYSFSVDLPEPVETTSPDEDAGGATAGEAAAEPQAEPQAETSSSADNSLYYYLGAGALLFVVALAFVRRKK